jgi:3-dehydroquinate synthase class II
MSKAEKLDKAEDYLRGLSEPQIVDINHCSSYLITPHELTDFSAQEISERELKVLDQMIEISDLEQENKELKSAIKTEKRLRTADVAYINELAKENKELIERAKRLMDCVKLISEKWDIPLKDLIHAIKHLNQKS